MKTILITGAGGYAGARLVERLRAAGHDVVAGVRSRARKLSYERVGVRSLVCDIADPINVARVVASARPDAIAHLAGMSRPADIARSPLEGYQATVSSWVHILDSARRIVPRARILLVSSADVYGNARGPVHEMTDCTPTTLGGSLRLSAEMLAGVFHRTYQLDLSIARTFPYTGPAQPESFYFPSALARLNAATSGATHNAAIMGLDETRDVLHIDDVLAAYERLLFDGRRGETYNVASGVGVTGRELLNAIISEEHLAVSLSDDGASTNGPGCVGDASKLMSELGWKPAHSAVDAVRALWHSLRHAAEPALSASH